MSNLIKTLEQSLGLSNELTLKEFVESKDYCNLDSVYPFWMDTMCSWPDTINEVVASGSIGGGKSFAMSIYLLYRLCKLFQMGNPQKVLGLDANSDIYILYFSTDKTTAKDTGFQYLINIVDSCAWFKNYCPRDPNINSEIRFKNNVTIKYASAEGHALGKNVWGFILDEANFRKGVGQGTEGDYVEVYQMCAQLVARQSSRFSTPDGVNALAIFISSASFESSFIETRKEMALQNPNARAVTAVQYKICPQKYSKETFKMFCGYGTYEPCIVEDESQFYSICKMIGVEPENSSNFFEDVPVSLKNEFITDPYLAIQNHCGRSTNVKGSLITNPTIVKRCYDDTLQSIFIQDKVTAYNTDDIPISDFVDLSRIRYPERPHSLFLDLSVQGDAGGLTLVRYDGKNEKGRPVHTHVFTIRIMPPSFPAMTEIAKVREFIYWLADHVTLVAFGSDQYQSTQIRQEVNKFLGLDDIRISLDSSDVFFTMWISALVEQRFRMLYIPYLDKEIFEAKHDLKRRRVVKREGSQDDAFQTVVGAFYLSETVAATGVSMTDLYSANRANLVGEASVRRMLKKLGYKKF